MIEQAFIDHERAVYIVAMGILKNHQAAEDIVQTTFMKAWIHRDELVDDGRGLAPWLVRVARNASIDYVRERKHLLPAAEVRNVAARDTAHLWAILLAAMATLPEPQRTVVFLRHFVGLVPTTIAQHLDRSLLSINGLLNRGTAQLRATLKQDGDPRA